MPGGGNPMDADRDAWLAVMAAWKLRVCCRRETEELVCVSRAWSLQQTGIVVDGCRGSPNATDPHVCDAGTQNAFDRGSTTKTPRGRTFHVPFTHSNHPAETFLKGMPWRRNV